VSFVIVGNVAHERIVELGLRTPDGLVEVLKGLKAGETLVVRGGEALREGAKVRVSAARSGAPKASAASGRPRLGASPTP
jgi:multidrug efflux system membrane fusion protein